jgi:hypothetical protein
MCQLVTLLTSLHTHQPFVYNTSTVGSILQSHKHTFFVPSDFLFLDAYHILFYAMSLSFLFIQFFATLGTAWFAWWLNQQCPSIIH